MRERNQRSGGSSGAGIEARSDMKNVHGIGIPNQRIVELLALPQIIYSIF